MRILNTETDKKLNEATLFLKKTELQQLRSYINQLIENPNLQHFHLSSADYQKEITICIYDESNLENFDDRSKRLILEDE